MVFYYGTVVAELKRKSGSCAITVYGIRNALQKDKSIVLRAMNQAVFVV